MKVKCVDCGYRDEKRIRLAGGSYGRCPTCGGDLRMYYKLPSGRSTSKGEVEYMKRHEGAV